MSLLQQATRSTSQSYYCVVYIIMIMIHKFCSGNQCIM